jgi:S-adenosylmethionine:tRNA ribosyltransferase-isomerase
MTPRGAAGAATRFALPADGSASEPPEARGLTRDEVRLMVATEGSVHHGRFRDLPQFLRPGDLLVINTSATLPAAADGRREGGASVSVHFSAPLGRHDWVVELRPDPDLLRGPVRDTRAGEKVLLTGGAVLTVGSGFPDSERTTGSRLWRARLDTEVLDYLDRYGRPIRYGYVPQQWPLEAYQTVYATQPGSAEMPSAGRPFTPALLTRLVASGVAMAPLVLHTGVSSLDADEAPYPERYEVPPATARLVNHTRATGGRVIAVGTTVVRALETMTLDDGTATAGSGWTELVLTADRPTRAVTGILTGLHAPGASHLQLLEAVAGLERVQQAYDAAVRHGYLWHEFGDSCLLLRHH